MPLWYRSTLVAKEALVSANASLENARSTQDRKRALKYCDEAETALRRIDISAATTDQSALEQIIAAFGEHGRVLESWKEIEKAQKSYNKAKRLRDEAIAGTATHAPASVASQSPTSLQNAIVPSSGGSPASPLSASAGGQVVLPSSAGNTISSPNLELIPASIFSKDPDLHVLESTLPKPDRRLDDTRQLAYCLGLLLQDPASPDVIIDAETRTWLQATSENTEEQERLKEMARDLLREFAREELKDATAVAEVVLLAPVFAKQDFRFLLGEFVDNLSSSVLLNTRALDGLDQVVQSALPFSVDADDLVKILKHLNLRLEDTHSDSLDYIYRLTSVVSHVLDTMALGGVQGLDRVNLHAPLTVYLQKLIKSVDPYLAFQAAYASQALLWVPNDEELWKAALRRAGTVTTGLARLVSAAKGLNVVEFIDGLGNIQEGLEGAGQFFGLVTDAFKGVTELIESGQGFQQSLKEGFSFSRKRKWYPVLRATDTLLRDGELVKFKRLVCDAPCRGDVAFQWGLCQRLGSVAADPHWDSDTRQGAIAFLEEIYRNDTVWGQNVQVKQCILIIFKQLASESDSVTQSVELLLRDLKTDGDAIKQAQYQACLEEGSSPPRPWKVVPPVLKSSPLLDRVQKKLDIQPRLREFRRQRLEGRGQEVYIPPEAKAGRQDPNETLFSLTDYVGDFLSSDQRVLLILGDSGAGKSTFNRELEWELWDAYDKDKARIPIFVWLPAVDKPEKDIIAQQLKDSGFNEGQIRELKDYYEFVLICDGYDECHLTCNLYDTNGLNKPGRWKAKMVVSCRSEHLGQSYRSLFQPKDGNDQCGDALLQEAVIAPFSTSKIRSYVEKYVERYTSKKRLLWKVDNYMSAIEGIPGFQELVSNPFLLKLSLDVLPEIVGQKDLSAVRVTRVALYDKYIENWVKERGEERLVKNGGLNESQKKAFKILLDDDFVQNTIDYVKNLAVAIFENQDGKAVVKYSRKERSWKDEFFSPYDDETTILREASPVIRIGKGNQFKFIHLSFQEYGLARAVFEPRREEDEDEEEEEQEEEEEEDEDGLTSMDQGAKRGAPVDMKPAPDSPSPLFRKSYVNRPSIIQFLAERVQQEPTFQQELLVFIEQSKLDKRWSIAAANAITILVRARILFNGADLKGIRIPGADLSGGQFDSTQLQGADLSNVTLRNIWLRHANLNNAQMEGVEFGERPYLTEESAVRCGAYSPDGKTCVIGLENGTVSVCDTSTWAKTHTLQGHRDSINRVVYSPNGQQIASCSSDKTVRLWDTHTGEPGPILSGHTWGVESVAYSPSGQQIASGSFDNTVRLWDALTGTPGLVLSGHTDWVLNVAYSPSGHKIASCSMDKTVRLWDAQTGEPGPTLSGHTDASYSIVYSPSGQQIASGSDDKTVRLWDVQTGAAGLVLSSHTHAVRSVVYSPSGRQIASGSFDNTVRLWDSETGESGPVLSGHTRWIRDIAYSPSGRQIASASDDKTVRLWDAQTGAPGPILSGHTNAVRSVVYSTSGRQIVSGSEDKTVRPWDAHTGAYGLILSGHTSEVRSVVYSPSNRQIASGSFDKTVRLWDAQTGGPGPILRGHTSWIRDVVYSPSGQQIASGSEDKTVRLWDAQTGAHGPALSDHTEAVLSVAYSPNGKQIASGSGDRTVQLWDAQSGASGRTLSGHTGGVTSIVYSPSGQQIASGSFDKTVRLWDAQTGAPGHIFEGHTKVVRSVVFSPNGRQIISSGDDRTMRLWDPQSGASGPILTGHISGVRSVVYSPSGQQIASGGEDKTVRLWDAQTGAPGFILSGHTNWVNCVRYSPSGRQIATGSWDKILRLWDVNSGQCLAVVHDINGPITSITWDLTPNSTCFATGCEDSSVRMWQVMEEEGRYFVRLQWSSLHHRLVVSNISIQGVQGLSKINMQLLEQRGSVGEPITPSSFHKTE